MTKKQQRGLVLLVSLVFVALAIALILVALQESIVFFKTPSGLIQQKIHGQYQRLGGQVKRGSFKRDPKTYTVSFIVTDQNADITVTYQGVLPNLFREGQGVVLEGRFVPPIFHAEKLFVKHDETYRPPTQEELTKGELLDSTKDTQSRSLEVES